MTTIELWGDDRSPVIDALYRRGFVGPPYSLDDIPARVERTDHGYHVSLYDMCCFVLNDDPQSNVFKQLFQSKGIV